MQVRLVALVPCVAIAMLPLAACSATTADPAPASQSSEAVTTPHHGPTLAQCEAFLPTCTVSPSSWALATPGELGNQVAQQEADAWIQELQWLGCTTPVSFDSDPSKWFSTVPLTMCPAWVVDVLPDPWPFLPSAGPDDPSAPYTHLEMGCNHCFPFGPPPGFVFLAWNPELNSPSTGCDSGGCYGLN
jgi:hypothetical protein